MVVFWLYLFVIEELIFLAELSLDRFLLWFPVSSLYPTTQMTPAISIKIFIGSRHYIASTDTGHNKLGEWVSTSQDLIPRHKTN